SHYFDPVVHRQVGTADGVQGEGAEAGWQAVVHQIVDGEPAGEELLAIAAELAQGDTRRVLDHIIEVVHALVVHALACDHADRLRRLADRQRQTGGRAHGPGGVGAAALGGGGAGNAADRVDVDR